LTGNRIRKNSDGREQIRTVASSTARKFNLDAALFLS
jgi:hypothetical protein